MALALWGLPYATLLLLGVLRKHRPALLARLPSPIRALERRLATTSTCSMHLLLHVYRSLVVLGMGLQLWAVPLVFDPCHLTTVGCGRLL